MPFLQFDDDKKIFHFNSSFNEKWKKSRQLTTNLLSVFGKIATKNFNGKKTFHKQKRPVFTKEAKKKDLIRGEKKT